MTVRVALDTNVVVSALVFSGGRLAGLRAAWQSGRIQPSISRPVAEELIRVLQYPKFRLEVGERESLLGDYLPSCEVVPVKGNFPEIPECRDPHDRKFLELAFAGKADFLVTGDADLLSLADALPFGIVTAEDLRARRVPPLRERAPPRYIPAAGKKPARPPENAARKPGR